MRFNYSRAFVSLEEKMKKFALLSVGIVLGLLVTGFQAQAEDVCGAKSRSSSVIGKTVTFRGKILSDGSHATIVNPDNCRTEGYGVLWTGVEGDPASTIRSAITNIGLIGTSDKDVSVDVDAVVVMLPNGKVGVKLTSLNRLVLTYPKADAG